MKEDSEKAVACLINHLYRGTIPSFRASKCGPYDESPIEKINRESHEDLILESYFLAEKHCMPYFMDMLMTELQAFRASCIRHPIINPAKILRIYDNTHGDSELRRYIASS